MIVTAMLSWWNEQPEDLDRCIRSLAGITDRVIALDGAYRRYPDATITSPKDQTAAIREAADAVGIESKVIVPKRLWAGQVEKRNYLVGLAAKDSDWVQIVDADYVIHADPKLARRELERVSGDVVTVRLWTPPNDDRPLAESAAGQWHMEQAAAVQEVPHFLRALPDLRVEKFHWWYSAMKGDERVWLWVDSARDRSYRSVPHYRMMSSYRIEHRTLFRTKEQIRASRAYLNDRAMVVKETAQEDHVAGLPDPEFDYEKLPA